MLNVEGQASLEFIASDEKDVQRDREHAIEII
jgi:hypothetical protein